MVFRDESDREDGFLLFHVKSLHDDGDGEGDAYLPLSPVRGLRDDAFREADVLRLHSLQRVRDVCYDDPACQVVRHEYAFRCGDVELVLLRLLINVDARGDVDDDGVDLCRDGAHGDVGTKGRCYRGDVGYGDDDARVMLPRRRGSRVRFRDRDRDGDGAHG